MAVIRSRFLFWLLKAYFRKWGKQFLFFFIIGLSLFILLLRISPILLHSIPFEKKTTIGIFGSYTTENMPENILNKVARGLTKIGADGIAKPDLAASWEIRNNGKIYIFHLKKNIKFTDGTEVTSNLIPYAFTNVLIQRPDPYTITFILKDAYAPFLITVAKPIFYKGYIGVGEYTINNIELNGSFLKTVQLRSIKDSLVIESYLFYPTEEALKTAFALGEITKATGLYNTTLTTKKNVDLQAFPGIQVKKTTNYKQLVTLFYNTQDPWLSDKKLRNGLGYALPNNFSDGERTYNPYSPHNHFYNIEIATRTQNFQHAQLLISSAIETASASAKPALTIKTLTKYKHVAQQIKRAWEQTGIKVAITEVDSIPEDFQIYLGDFNVPKDPDQYTLWHSAQVNNITQIKSLRLDKLLEDGRRKIDAEERQSIYLDFQKYLFDESPASFLYFPYEYEISRK